MVPTKASGGVSGPFFLTVGALTTAGNAAGAAARAAANAGKHSSVAAQPPIFILEILGYGGGDGAINNQQQPNKRKRLNTQARYNPNSAVQFVGLGDSTNAQKNRPTTEDRGDLHE